MEAGQRGRALQLAGAVVVVVFAAIFLIGNHQELPDAWRAMRHADAGWLLVATAFLLAGLVNTAALYGASLRAAGATTPPAATFRVATTAHALNLFVKSGGMAGLPVFVADARRRRQPRGPVVAGYLLTALLAEVGFALTLFVALVVMIAGRRLAWGEVVATVIYVGYLVIRLTLVVTAVRSRERLRAITTLPRRAVAQIRRRPVPDPSEFDHTAADELHEAVTLVRRHPRASAPALVHAVLMEVIGIGLLWAVLGALGVHRGLALPFVAYSISVLFGIIGFLPGGLGFVELSTGAALTSYGVPVAVATAAVVVYRVFELWLPALAGLLTRRGSRRSTTGTTDDGTNGSPAPEPTT